MATATVADVLARLGRTAPWSKAAGWDPVGLTLGDPAAPAERVGVCHEVTGPVVEAVEADPPQLLITYHPLLFHPVRRLVAGPDAAGRAWRLARVGVALAVAHTNFDVAPGGAADALADSLLLGDLTGFGAIDGEDTRKLVVFVPQAAVERVAEALATAGAGRIGNYSACSFRTDGVGAFRAEAGAEPVAGIVGEASREPEVRIETVVPAASEQAAVAAMLAAHPYEEPAYDVYDRRGNAGLAGRVGRAPAGSTLGSLAQRVSEQLGGVVRLAAAGDARVERVAVVPGSGAEFAAAARATGADVLVTGDVPHHAARRALDAGLAIIDPGHVATERPGVVRLREIVAGVVEEVVDLTGIDPGPWRSAS